MYPLTTLHFHIIPQIPGGLLASTSACVTMCLYSCDVFWELTVFTLKGVAAYCTLVLHHLLVLLRSRPQRPNPVSPSSPSPLLDPGVGCCWGIICTYHIWFEEFATDLSGLACGHLFVEKLLTPVVLRDTFNASWKTSDNIAHIWF